MADNVRKLSFGELMAATSAGARRHAALLLAYIAVITLAATLLDSMAYLSSFVANVMVFVTGFFLYTHLLRREGLIAAHRSGHGFGAYFGVSILSGVAIVIGLVLLILPGLVLMARWSIASGLTIAEGRSTTDAMARSWDATRGSQWAIVLAYFLFGLVLVGAPTVLLGVGIGLFAAWGEGSEFAGSLIANLCAQLASVASFVFSVAVIQSLSGSTDELEAVFS